MKKEHIIGFSFLIVLMIIFISDVNAAEEFYFCNADSVNAFKVIGYIITVIKIIVPIGIMVFASIDYFRAIMSNDEKAISVSTKAFIRRLIAGIIIFFVPTIVYALLNVITPAIGDTKFTEYEKCTKCMFNPGSCDTSELPDLKPVNNS